MRNFKKLHQHTDCRFGGATEGFGWWQCQQTVNTGNYKLSREAAKKSSL